jgi:hypothetical protein
LRSGRHYPFKTWDGLVRQCPPSPPSVGALR